MESVLTQVGIIGAGELGQALGNALTRARLQVLYYDKDASRSTTGSIDDLINSCEVLIICVPSWDMGSVTKQIAKASHPNAKRIVITCSKGVERGFMTMDQLLRERLPDHYDIGVLYGPMIASEIEIGRPGHGVMALSNPKWFTTLREHFGLARIDLEMSADLHGVALCAPLKNIYAIGFGLIDGLNLGLNSKGKLAVMVLAEMKRLLADLHADPHTAEGLAGLGDILATGFSEASFNYRVGRTLAEKIADEHIRSEGLVALNELEHHVQLKHYPVVDSIDKIVFHYAEPKTLSSLLSVQ
jgi:glycerol-3-phosphate dehydrogenase (NAD(P)+)